MDLRTPPSKNFDDHTGRSAFENQLRHQLGEDLSPQEIALMKKNGWSAQDMLILRGLNAVKYNPSRAPDKDYPRGWLPEENP